MIFVKLLTNHIQVHFNGELLWELTLLKLKFGAAAEAVLVLAAVCGDFLVGLALMHIETYVPKILEIWVDVRLNFVLQ
jgi:hypothetical protein